MEDEHRKSIQKNFTSLVEQTDLDLMVTALYEKGVFSEQMIEPYKDSSKDARSRKRQLYMDITRRGPRAFEHLLEALTEAGHWGVVRDLDPTSALHFSPPTRNPGTSSSSSRSAENNFLSISAEKKKSKPVVEVNKSPEHTSAKPLLPTMPSKIPELHIVKSTKFFEETGDEIKLYRTRGRQRGILLLFSYTQFEGDEKYRSGADVDCHNLKYLFDEFGFKTLVYTNLTRQETLDTLGSLRQVQLHRAECVFVVVSSHGHERADGSDVDVSCHDGRVSAYRFIEYFSNNNFPELIGKPKVFIFQICRGPRENGRYHFSERDHGRTGARESDGAPRGAPSAAPDDERKREYSDILIAHSTVPGYVSYRDPEKGSWYIQTLCSVFAARAHERHVHDLLTLVDQRLAATYRGQTSSIDKWGFNHLLYLHPGLFEDHPVDSTT